MPKNVLGGDVPVRGDGDDILPNDTNETALWGDGSDGSYTSGNNLDSGVVYNFTDFVLNSGDTLRRASGDNELPIIIRVQGDVTIDGTIDLQGQGMPGATDTGYGYAGLGDDPSIAKNWIDINGQDNEVENYNYPIRWAHHNYMEGPMGGEGGYGSDTAGNSGGSYPGSGGNPPPNWLQNAAVYELINNPVFLVPGAGGGGGVHGETSDNSSEAEGGAGGGGGASRVSGGSGGSDGTQANDSGNDAAPGGNGGDGGGSIMILCGGNLEINGTIDVRGEDGDDGSNADGAGGGGGGGGAGNALLLYKGSLTDNGTKLASGGSGGSGGTSSMDYGGDGGNGGSGGSGQIVITSP